MARKPAQIRFRSDPQRGLPQGTGSALGTILKRLGPLHGNPITVTWRADLRASRGKLRSGGDVGDPVHAGSFLRKRTITLDTGLLKSKGELARIAAHELFHFVWLRLGNAARRSWETLLAGEIGSRARGELGWSAEWRKERLTLGDLAVRSRKWREYCCESFCDTGAWLYAGLKSHEEFSLGLRAAARRRVWFESLRRHHSEGWRI